MAARPKVLIICDYYLPGHESGGAVRTLTNLVDRLGDRYEFVVITRDHDGTAVRRPYDSIDRGAWNTIGNARVYYLRPDQVRAQTVARLVRETNPDAVYLNSFFSRLTIIYLALCKLRRVTAVPLVLAPEGEFSPGALELGALKKNIYINAAKPLLLSRSIHWKAASEEEREDIIRIIGQKATVHVAPNMPPRTIFAAYYDQPKPTKEAGKARMVFLSRFMRKKNFNWLLQHLGSVTGDLSIDVYGTLEEPDYVDEFHRLAAHLPRNINVSLRGPVAHADVSPTLFSYQFFILPTLGENFGHVFIEALAAGCPLIISDRTPWRSLPEKEVGWDMPLEQPDVWAAAISDCVAMPDAEYQRLAANARSFAENWLVDPTIESSNIDALDSAVRSTGHFE